MAASETEDSKLSVRLCIEHDSDCEMYWSMNTVYASASTPIYELITENMLDSFDYHVSECPLILLAGNQSIPESAVVGDFDAQDRSAILLTRALVDAEVVWRRGSTETCFVVNISDGFNYSKLKAGITKHTPISMEKQYVRFDGDLENRKKKGLENLMKEEGISKHFTTLLPTRLRFIVEEVEPIMIQVSCGDDVAESEMIVSPKLTSQRLAQDLCISDGTEVSYKTHRLLFGNTHLMLSSPYGFVCTDPRPDSTLGGYGVTNGSTLIFKKRDRSLSMIVHTVSGAKYQLEGFTTEDFTADIMWEVAERKDWEWPDPMRLICLGHNLDHLKQLKEYEGINQDSTIHIVPRMRRS